MKGLSLVASRGLSTSPQDMLPVTIECFAGFFLPFKICYNCSGNAARLMVDLHVPFPPLCIMSIYKRNSTVKQMNRNLLSRPRLTKLIERKLYCSLKKQKSNLTSDDFNGKGYVTDFKMNLLPSYVLPKDFECELRTDELEEKFLAPHSSSALTVNCFAPFRRRINELVLPIKGNFHKLQFEKKCPISNQHSTNLQGGLPHLDVLLSGESGVIGIETKLIEHIRDYKCAEFSDAYLELTTDDYTQKFFEEMHVLIKEKKKYTYLDATQLIKHAFGLANTYKGKKQITLLYVYWQPEDPDHPKYAHHFQKHKKEIKNFKKQVNGSKLNFHAISYPEIWDMWSKHSRTKPWLSEHISNLKERYLIRLCD